MMLARSFRRFVPALFLLVLVLPSLSAQEAALERLRRDVVFLASDECEGRGVETKGINLAADYIAKEFAKAGLKPGLGEKGFFQPFTIAGPGKENGLSHLVLQGPQGQQIHLKRGQDFVPLAMSATGKLDGTLVFAGYGVAAKEEKYDDYAGVDVAGKVVVLLRRVPRWDSKFLPFDGKKKMIHAGLSSKLANAEMHKAAAVILVNDSSEPADKLVPFEELMYDSARGIPVLQMRRDLLDELLRTSQGRSLREIEKSIDGDLTPRSAALPGWRAALETNVVHPPLHVKNVVGVLEGSGPLAKETVVLGAHYDHLGFGGPGAITKTKAIHYGADDNASGTAALMELARRFGGIKDRQGRRLVFIAFSAEERGLFGSKHYCDKEPIFPLDATTAMFNLDMVGRLPKDKEGRDLLLIEGAGTSKTFPKLIHDENNAGGMELKLAKELMPNSDHYPFFNKKVPVIFFWTGTHMEYHRPTDTAERINYEGIVKIVGLSEKVIARLASDSERPVFVSIPVIGSGGRGDGPRLGIMPNYEAGTRGVRIGEVIDGGAAHKGGLRGGDLIVEIANQQVIDIDTYMIIMRAQKSGEPVDVTILRGDKKMTLKVTPQ